MACFLVTTAAAIGVGAAKYIVRHHEKKDINFEKKDHFIDSKKLGYLELTLWGGSVLLAGEHVFHGEITYKFPWLTAVAEGETIEMLQEIGTVGVGMLAIIVASWGIGLLIRRLLLKRKANKLVKE